MDRERHSSALDALISLTDPRELAELARSLHPTDLASAFEELTPERRQELFACLDNVSAAALLDEMDGGLRASILAQLTVDRASDIVEEMPADEAADLLNDLPDSDADAILSAMESQEAAEVRELLDYESDSAGGQMTTEFIAVDESLTVEETIHRLRELAPEAETVYYLYVVGEGDHLVGVVSLRSLIVSDPAVRVADIMCRDVISVSVDADQEEAADLIARYNLAAVPVVDADGCPIGIITVDDAVDVIDEETTEDIYELAGAADEPEDTRSLGGLLRQRASRWTGILAASLAAGAVLGWVGHTLNTGTLAGSAQRPYDGLALDIVAFLPAMLGLSWLLQGQVHASLFGRLGAGGERPQGIWLGVSTEIVSSLGAALACGAIVAAALYVSRPHNPAYSIVGASLSAGLVVSVIGAHLIPRLMIAAGRGRSASPAVSTTFAHTAGVLAYLSSACWVVRP